MHANSIAAYRQEEPKLNRRELLILAWCDLHPGRWTDRQIMRGMGFNEPNCVRPRITRLVDLGQLVEVGSVVCEETRKTVRQVARPVKQFNLFNAHAYEHVEYENIVEVRQ